VLVELHETKGMLMAIKEQKEGVARVFDTLSATAIIAASASMAGYGSIAAKDVALLCFIIPFLLVLSWFLRSK